MSLKARADVVNRSARFKCRCEVIDRSVIYCNCCWDCAKYLSKFLGLLGLVYVAFFVVLVLLHDVSNLFDFGEEDWIRELNGGLIPGYISIFLSNKTCQALATAAGGDVTCAVRTRWPIRRRQAEETKFSKSSVLNISTYVWTGEEIMTEILFLVELLL